MCTLAIFFSNYCEQNLYLPVVSLSSILVSCIIIMYSCLLCHYNLYLPVVSLSFIYDCCIIITDIGLLYHYHLYLPVVSLSFIFAFIFACCIIIIYICLLYHYHLYLPVVSLSCYGISYFTSYDVLFNVKQQFSKDAQSLTFKQIFLLSVSYRMYIVLLYDQCINSIPLPL